MSELLFATLLVTGLLILVATLDDILVDLMVLWRGSDRLSPFAAGSASVANPPRIAVFVANWHEEDVLEEMVEGNIARIDYPQLKLILGVYPNDTATRAIAEKLERRHPGAVEVIVNRCSGPTSKGQMLNEMFARVFENRATAPDIVVLHDSEDVIAPRSFEIYADACRESAMVQVPVFSLDSRDRSMVGATYMEEFAERHTREMALRAELGAFVPSAGVGTALRKDLVVHFLETRGHVLQPGSVTEDYILGAEAHVAGFKTTFRAVRDATEPGAPIIATREYFPKDFWGSIRQKTRWVYGITFEGTRRIGWKGQRGWNLFFLYRDRKGAIANLLPLASLLLLVVGLIVGFNLRRAPAWQLALLWPVLALNTISILVRVWFKARAFHAVYREHDVLGILLRWPVAMVVNAVAVARAWRTFVVESRWASRPIAWAKTRHELPALFGSLSAVGTGLQPALANARRPSLLRLDNRSRGYLASGLALALLVALLSSYLRQPRTFTSEDHLAAAEAARVVIARLEEGERELVSLAVDARSRLARLAWLDADRTVSGGKPSIVGDVIAHPETAAAAPFEEGDAIRALAELSIARVEVSELAILTKSRRQRPALDVLEPGDEADFKLAGQSATGSDPRQPAGAEATREGMAARKLATQSLAAIDVEQWRILDIARRRQANDIELLSALPEGQVMPVPGLAGAPPESAAVEAVEARRLARQTLEERAGREQEILARTRSQLAAESTEPSTRQPAGDAQMAQELSAASLARSKEVDDGVLAAARDRALAALTTAPQPPEMAARQSSPTEATVGETDAVGGERSALAAGEARRLADVAISAAVRSEADILARAGAAGDAMGLDRPHALVVVIGVGARAGALQSYHDRNARIIAALLHVPSVSATPINARGTATRAVKAAQHAVNQWLAERKLTLSDLGRGEAARSPCGARLCVDGILGAQTKAVLLAVWQRDRSFGRANSARRN